MEVEKHVSICRINPTAVCDHELLVLADRGLCNQMGNLGEGEVAALFGRHVRRSCGVGLEMVHSGGLGD